MRSLTGLSRVERSLVLVYLASCPPDLGEEVADVAGLVAELAGDHQRELWKRLVDVASTRPPDLASAPEELVALAGRLTTLLGALVPEASGVAGDITHVRIVSGGRVEEGDFYEDDEPTDEIVAAFDRGQEGFTAEPESERTP